MGLNTYQAKKIPLTEILAKLGCESVRHREADVWYLSPFRQETEPSFKINVEKNLWYDFGEGQGGNVIDFAMKYWRCGVSEALHELSHLSFANKQEYVPALATMPESNPITLTRIQPLAHRALLLYLDQRGIDRETAQAYVQEIHYMRVGKPYFALAFASDSGGWEMRNPYFKGVYGPKDMTLLHQESTGGAVLVFEGFTDFLSCLTYYKLAAPPHPVIVMNSATMLDKTVVTIREFGAITVHLYLDRDTTGRRIMDAFQEQLQGVTVIDESGLYARHKDFNELLQALLKRGLSH